MSETANATATQTLEPDSPEVPQRREVPTEKHAQLDLPLVAAWTTEQCENALREGIRPEIDEIAGWEFNGYNHPFFASLLRIRKFMKGFSRRDDGRISGYNVMIRQNGGPLLPWEPVRLFGRPIRHGFYEVRPVDPYERDSLYPNALLLDYGSGDNFAINPIRVLRDYLVQINPDDPDLLLGKAVVALGPLRRQMSFFILQRAHRADA